MNLLVICPVKDAPESSLRTIEHLLLSQLNIPFKLIVFNDFSLPENEQKLTDAAAHLHFELVHLSDHTTTPSPNYRLVLQMAQKMAINENAHLVIVESDVVVQTNTLQLMTDTLKSASNPGLVAAITTDENGVVNFPYLYARNYRKGCIATKKRLSFCCTLLSLEYLTEFDFMDLDARKNWYDVPISRKAWQLGYHNYLLTNVSVLHYPHSSRPWKQLKYTNPIRYYWKKITEKKDRI